MYTKTLLCRANGKSCIGCCVRHEGKTKEELKDVSKDIDFNTKELASSKDIKEFMGRSRRDTKPSGACINLVKLPDGSLGCAGHPKQNDGKDFRKYYKGYCHINFLCETADDFNKWREETRQKFLRFVEKKKMGIIDHSVGLDSEKLIKEFRKK